jgi:hypothetical protein
MERRRLVLTSFLLSRGTPPRTIVLVERACADSISTTSFCGCPNVSELEGMGFGRRTAGWP